ncbi:MAG TPA: hypothetical protein EYP91_09840 [Gammaproteobacteria bacterium]|nr:hypothetical protein [Gammaproteobacteria bacterium]
MMELPGRAVACSPESHGIHGALGGAGARTASEFVRDAWSWFHGAFSPNSKLREYVVPQKPIAEQENPKPKAYSRRGRARLVTCWNQDTFLKVEKGWLFVLTAEYFVCMCRMQNRGCLFCS